jgi:hypothetical protein
MAHRSFLYAFGMSGERLDDLKRFYQLTGKLSQAVGGARVLEECNGRSGWPRRGVYFFMEAGENRCATGTGPRVVRVGTHALKTGSGTSPSFAAPGSGALGRRQSPRFDHHPERRLRCRPGERADRHL